MLKAVVRDKSDERVEFIYELQDVLLNPPTNPDEDRELADYLRRKYEHHQVDLVLVLAAPRFREIVKKSPGLFAETPKIYYDFEEERDVTLRELGPHVTGVWGKLEFSQTLDVALHLLPQTRKVVVVAGDSSSDKTMLERARASLSKYQNRLEFTYLNQSVAETKSTLATLGPDTVVMYLSIHIDKAGDKFTAPESLSLITPTSAAPVFGNSETLIGYGIVGGSLLDLNTIGVRLGEVTNRVLDGESVESIPSQTIPNVAVFDWRQLRRWNIDEKNLPPRSSVRYRELTFWDQYKWYVISSLTAIVLEGILIAYLLIARAKRRRAESEMARLGRLAEDERKKLDELVSNVPGIVWESRVDPETETTQATFISNYVEKMLGYTADEWLSNQLGTGLDLMPAEDRAQAAHNEKLVMTTGKEGTSQFRWLTKNGNVVWTESYLAPISDGGDKVIGVRGVTLDVTGRKLAEESLRRTEERSSAIVQAIPDLIFLQTRDGVYLDFHCKDPANLLHSPDVFLGRNMRDLLPPQLAAEFATAFERAFKNGGPEVVEYSLPLQNKERWFEARIVRAGDNILSVVRDITDRKVALNELRQSEEHFSKAFKANPQPMSITTLREGRYIDVNQSFLAMSGYTREEVIGRTALELKIWGTPQARAHMVDLLKRDGSVVNLETRFHTKHRSVRTLLSSGELLTLAGEKCILLASSDITDRKAAEDALRNALEEVKQLKNQLEAENIYLQQELRSDPTFGEIVGQSNAIKRVLLAINQVAATGTTVLITGETGTGKELVARAIHRAGNRKDRPLIKLNCAALSPTLIESELFGHEKGAFTGAEARQTGRFELANKGTIFLDEIGDLPMDLQVKLLRVIQEGELERVGSTQTIKLDVRIIAATNRNLKQAVEQGTFREDLWYRLNVFPINTPSLRERRDDVPILVEHFVKLFAQKFGKEITAISPHTMTILSQYSWPGNIRELANVIERAVINCHSSVLKIGPDFAGSVVEKLDDEKRTLAEMEREYIIRILEDRSWRIEGPHGAARLLGMNPSTLRTRMAKLKIINPRQSFTKSV
jgi:PAS domain S-box-containing protein